MKYAFCVIRISFDNTLDTFSYIQPAKLVYTIFNENIAFVILAHSIENMSSGAMGLECIKTNKNNALFWLFSHNVNFVTFPI